MCIDRPRQGRQQQLLRTKQFAKMGNSIASAWQDVWPDRTKPLPRDRDMYGKPCPDPASQPTFDPMLGFPNGRKERVMKVTKKEMEDARVPMENRDYCAHYYIEFMRCQRDTSTFSKIFQKACKPAWHHYAHCRYEQEVLQYKEFEREKRLRERQKRRIALGLEPDPNEDMGTQKL